MYRLNRDHHYLTTYRLSLLDVISERLGRITTVEGTNAAMNKRLRGFGLVRKRRMTEEMRRKAVFRLNHVCITF